MKLRTLAVGLVAVLFAALCIAQLPKGGPTGRSYTFQSPLSESNGAVSCPTCGGGAGDVTGPASSVDSEVALFSGTGGKTLKRASTTGLAKLASGVLSAATAGTDYVAPISATFYHLPFGEAHLLHNGGGSAMAVANRVYIVRTRLAWPISATTMDMRVTTGSASQFIHMGLYSLDGNTRYLNCSFDAGSSTTNRQCSFGATAIPAGEYYYAFGATSTGVGCIVYGADPGTGFIDVAANAYGRAANTISGGSLPSTLGSLTFDVVEQPCFSVLR